MSTAAPDGRRPLFPMMALASVIILLVAGVLMAAFNERLYAQQKAREAAVQAAILADTVAAALIFDDSAAAQESVNALKSNPEVAAVGVFDQRGRLVARLVRGNEALPPQPRLQAPTFQHGRLTLTMPVNDKGGSRLGAVHLRLLVEPTWRRLGRYAGVALLIGMAAVVLAVLGVSQGALARANAALRAQAADLAESNRRLQEQIEETARAEEALRQAQRLEAMGRLTGGVAHDFNNLLMVASSGLDLLDRTEDAERREKLKAGIRQAMERGAALTSQLLAFSRRAALKPRVVDLTARIETMRVLLERSLREDITVRVDLPRDLWPVEIDDNEFELALLNIAVNARDAMPNGGAIIIRGENVAAEGADGASADHIRLSVSDTGTGMSPEVAARVFEPFFTTKPVGKGTGLGLSQVYGFARSSGGEVHIDSCEGHGVTVVITLPRSSKPLSEAAVAAEGSAAGRARGRVLMVEDDDEVAAMVDQMLVSLGYRVAREPDAERALRRLEGDPRFDLVFSDMVMPGDMDGRSLVREVQRRYPGLPVLLTTGYSEAAALATTEGLRLLTKPYRIDALAEAIRAARADGRKARSRRRERA
ncbi:MAG: response regulator [Caulobacteraceae bacterium]|nr:response regulator [Caulobacteraceae bacterium]